MLIVMIRTGQYQVVQEYEHTVRSQFMIKNLWLKLIIENYAKKISW